MTEVAKTDHTFNPEEKLKLPEATRTQILVTADETINGDRDHIYGPAETSFARIAALWSVIGFRVQTPDGKLREVNAVDVSMAMNQMKVSRLVNTPSHQDSWVDIAGYAALGGEISINQR